MSRVQPFTNRCPSGMNEWKLLAQHLEENPPEVDLDALCTLAENECAGWLVQHGEDLYSVGVQALEDWEFDVTIVSALGISTERCAFYEDEIADILSGQGGKAFCELGILAAKAFYHKD